MSTLPPAHHRAIGLIAGLLCVTTSVTAQTRFGTGGVELSTGYTFTAAGDAEFAGATQGEIELRAFRFAARHQRPISDTLTFGIGVDYEQFEIDASAGVPLPDTLRSVALSVSGHWVINPDWSLLAIAEPGIHTDTEASTNDGFAARGIVVAQRRLSPTLTLGLGVRLSSLGEHAVIPFPMLRWQPSPEWILMLGAPRTEVSFAFDRDTSFFAGASLLGGSFATDDPSLTPPPGQANLHETELDVSEIRLGAGVRRKFGRVSLELEGGVALERTYDYYDRDLEIEADPAPFARVNVIVEF